MSDEAPERIWFNNGRQNHERHTSSVRFAGGTEYLRSDLATRQQAEAVGAMAEAAAHLAEVAFACRSCGKVFVASDPHTDEGCPKGYANWDAADPEQVAEAIRALTPSDATAALEARDARVKRETYQKCLNMLNNHHPVDAINLIKACAKGPDNG